MRIITTLYLLSCAVSLISLKVIIDECRNEIYNKYQIDPDQLSFSNLFIKLLIVAAPIFNIIFATEILLYKDEIKEEIVSNFEENMNK